MTKENYDRLSQAIDVPEKYLPELIDFMVARLKEAQEHFAAVYHSAYTESVSDQEMKMRNYYDSLACDRAVEWLEEIKKQ